MTEIFVAPAPILILLAGFVGITSLSVYLDNVEKKRLRDRKKSSSC